MNAFGSSFNFMQCPESDVISVIIVSWKKQVKDLLRLACVLLSGLVYFSNFLEGARVGSASRWDVFESNSVLELQAKSCVHMINHPYTHHLIYFIVFAIMSRWAQTWPCLMQLNTHPHAPCCWLPNLIACLAFPPPSVILRFPVYFFPSCFFH